MEYVLIALLILLAIVFTACFCAKKFIDGLAYIISTIVNAFRK